MVEPFPNAKRHYIGRLMPPDTTRDIRLPIDEVLPALRDALRAHHCVVLQAPPGAGKTTCVAIALLNEPWLAGRRVLMLEPRRLATRAAARRMASVLGESVGQTVGFRVRGEVRVSVGTRVEVVTENDAFMRASAPRATPAIRALQLFSCLQDVAR